MFYLTTQLAEIYRLVRTITADEVVPYVEKMFLIYAIFLGKCHQKNKYCITKMSAV